MNFSHQWNYSNFYDAKDLTECGVYLRYAVPVRALHIMSIYAGACAATSYKDRTVDTYRHNDATIDEHHITGNGFGLL